MEPSHINLHDFFFICVFDWLSKLWDQEQPPASSVHAVLTTAACSSDGSLAHAHIAADS